MKRFQACLIGVSWTLATVAHAATGTQVSQATVSSATGAPAPQSAFGFRMALQASSGFQEFDSSEHTGGMTLDLEPSFQLSSDYKLSAQMFVKQDLENERRLTNTNTRLALTRRAIAFGPYISLVPIVGATLPTDRDAWLGDSFRGAVNVGPRVILDLSRAGLRGLSFSYRLNFTQNFYQYATSFLGGSNSERSLSNTLRADYALDDRWSFNLTYIRGVGFAYDGGLKNNFELSPSVAYAFSKKVSLEVGLDTLGEAYKENGTSSRVAVFDPNSTSVYGSLQLTL